MSARKPTATSRRLGLAPHPRPNPTHQRAAASGGIAKTVRRTVKKTARNKIADNSNEPVTAVYSAASGDDTIDDRHHAVRHAGVQVPARRGAAGSRLSDHPGADLLSRRQSRRDDVVGDRAAGSAVRPDAEPEPDELGEFRRLLRN